MGLQISYGGNPSPVALEDKYSGMGHWGGGPGTAGGLQQNIENAFGVNEPIGYNPDIVAANAPAVNTGNEFSGGYPASAPSQWGSFDFPTQQPTMFNMNPYVETFNTGFPTPMNPAYNIDNIVQPSFGLGQYNSGFPNQLGIPVGGYLGNSNPFGSMFGGQGWVSQAGREG